MLMKTKSKSRKQGLIAEINITPFVDILLVILIVFMITAPMLNNGFEVSLPKSVKNDLQMKENEQVVVSLDNKSNLYIDDKKIVIKDLPKLLSKYNKEKTQVFIKADKAVKYQEVISVMSTLNKNGFLNISLVTEN